MSPFFILSTYGTCTWVCRSLEVTNSTYPGSNIHNLGPINLKLVLAGKSSMYDADVLHKYSFQNSSLWALAE